MVRGHVFKTIPLIPGGKYSKTPPFQGLLVTPDLAVSPCQLSVLGLAVGNRCGPGPQLPELLHPHHKQDTLFIWTDGLERAERHSDWPCWCVHAGLWHQHAEDSGISTQRTLASARRGLWHQHAGRVGTSHARLWRADVTAVSVSRGGVRGLPRALSAARAESEGPVSSLPALGQTPSLAGPCVPHGSSVPDQVQGGH